MNDKPVLANDVWVAPGVQMYGGISIEAGSSVWPQAVLRAESNEIRVGRMTNLQDFVMVHVGYGISTIIGDFCSITHHAVIHGATIGHDCLVGIHATVMDGAEIGAGSIVAGGAMVTEGTKVPPGSVVAGVPAKVIAERDSSQANRLNAWLYHRNAAAFREGNHRTWAEPDLAGWLSTKKAEISADLDLEGFER